jgi:hypothetical protein
MPLQNPGSLPEDSTPPEGVVQVEKPRKKLSIAILAMNLLISILLISAWLADATIIAFSGLALFPLVLVTISILLVMTFEWTNHKLAKQLTRINIIIASIICYLIIIIPLIYEFVLNPTDYYSNGFDLSGLVIYFAVWIVKRMILKKYHRQDYGVA